MGGRSWEVTPRGSHTCSPRRKLGHRQGSPPQTADAPGTLCGIPLPAGILPRL